MCARCKHRSKTSGKPKKNAAWRRYATTSPRMLYTSKSAIFLLLVDPSLLRILWVPRPSDLFSGFTISSKAVQQTKPELIRRIQTYLYAVYVITIASRIFIQSTSEKVFRSNISSLRNIYPRRRMLIKIVNTMITSIKENYFYLLDNLDRDEDTLSSVPK